MKFFTNCKSLDELKAEYRKLVKLHHPDRGGDPEVMKAINNEYEKRFEELKRRLMAEGLFDAGRKRPLPLLPGMIGIVTARTGAVIHDIATVTRRRFPAMQIILRPAQVQGEGAAEDIAAGIAEISALPQVDVVIVGRGGGSLEDLWAFNEEIVVRAIAACPVPVVSAVGHEVDVTLSDLAADVRAAIRERIAEKFHALNDRALAWGAAAVS
jgi:exodeoxyribonuclease VII large subunit